MNPNSALLTSQSPWPVQNGEKNLHDSNLERKLDSNPQLFGYAITAQQIVHEDVPESEQKQTHFEAEPCLPVEVGGHPQPPPTVGVPA